MQASRTDIVQLETRFWQSMVDQDTDTALDLLDDTALMVSSHGAMQFDHDGYRKMAEHGTMTVTAFAFDAMQVMFPNDSTAVLSYQVKQDLRPRDKSRKALSQLMHDTSTWVRKGGDWKCVMHTETPVQGKA